MDNYPQKVLMQLTKITQEMQRSGLWQILPPAKEAFLSSQPFSIDTMEPIAWLQWIFIPRMQALIDAKADLPRQYALYPYFEEALNRDKKASTLLNLLKQLDELAF